MAAPAGTANPKGGRREHATRVRFHPPERSKRDPRKTRERIMAAVVESIAEVGFHRTSGAEIAKRAGVTWGAVQHHFGDKNGILIAVLEDSFNRLLDRLATVDPALALEERVSQFIDRAWEHFATGHHRSTYEILNHYASVDPELTFQAQAGAALARSWATLFGDSRISRRRQLVLQRYAISLLSGLASVRAFGMPERENVEAERQLLKDTLVRELRPRAGAG